MTFFPLIRSGKISVLWLLICLLILILSQNFSPSVVSQPRSMPTVNDANLKVELVAEGIEYPTSMAFLGKDDILVLEKNDGTVRRILNGTMLQKPILDVNVANISERGMLGIVVANSQKGIKYVFLYYTEAESKDGEDVSSGKSPLGNRLYRYELDGDKLINPKLLLDLPVIPGGRHNGGVVLVGEDKLLYLVVGDVAKVTKGSRTQAQNFMYGPEPDGSSGILRISQDGLLVGDGILGNKYPLNLYYAYGIRNSFGMDFDPVTGNLWDTENGRDHSDEINRVEPGFNSGWEYVQGLWDMWNETRRPKKVPLSHTELENFNGTGVYSDPEFVWQYPTVAPTALKFLNSSRLGSEYKNDLFVGSWNVGTLYHFDLSKDRTSLMLNGSLADKVANSLEEIDEGKIFGQGFGLIVDIEVGPDGNLYVLSHYNNLGEGSIFRIVPSMVK
jgi:glucose/arabinose dehydrogenase